jgi:hypothetical protein
MLLRLLALACLVSDTTFAAEAPKLPSIAASGNEKSERHTSFPAQPIAQKKELLFADDFEKAELGEVFESRCVHCVFPRAIQPLQG